MDRCLLRIYLDCHVVQLACAMQGSPNTQQTVESKESYRHSLAVTAMRPGLKSTPYLYTLNLSCPEERWDELEPYYQQAIESFRLVQPNQVLQWFLKFAFSRIIW